MKLTNFMNAVVMTAAITMGGLAAHAQQAASFNIPTTQFNHFT
jgi:hypothetical protein